MGSKRLFEVIVVLVLVTTSYSYPLQAQTPTLTPRLFLPALGVPPSGVSGYLYADEHPLGQQVLRMYERLVTVDAVIPTLIVTATTDSTGYFSFPGKFPTINGGYYSIFHSLEWGNQEQNPNWSNQIVFAVNTLDPTLNENMQILLGRINVDELVLQTPVSGTTVTLPVEFAFTVPSGQPVCTVRAPGVVEDGSNVATVVGEIGRFTLTRPILEEYFGQPGDWVVACANDTPIAKWTQSVGRSITITRPVNE